MSEYEITYLSSGQLDEETRAQLDGAIDALVEQHKGKIIESQPNVRRRLFFHIKKQQIAFARVLQVEVLPAQITPLQTAITKSNGILRVSIVKTPARESVTLAIFDSLKTPATPGATPTPRAEVKKDAKPVTMEEVEEKIEEALDEEVK